MWGYLGAVVGGIVLGRSSRFMRSMMRAREAMHQTLASTAAGGAGGGAAARQEVNQTVIVNGAAGAERAAWAGYVERSGAVGDGVVRPVVGVAPSPAVLGRVDDGEALMLLLRENDLLRERLDLVPVDGEVVE